MRILHKKDIFNEEKSHDSILLTKDREFLQLQSTIDNKEQMLLDKKNKIYQISKENQFLANVKDDYAKYYNFIELQKKEQIKTLERLYKYTVELNKLNKFHKENLENEKLEQDKILREIKNIKNSINNIII
jgi:predicted nuclease of predicted toxin-antitoxin system